MATVTVTAQNVEDMVDAAGYGIAYWAVNPTDEQWATADAPEDGQ